MVLSSIGLGTAALGRPEYINIRKEKKILEPVADFRKRSLSTIEYAYKKGIRYFDTAPGYGLAEELLIDWAKSKQDPTIEIGTKWGYTYTANFDPNATIHEVKEHSLSKLNEQWQQSKKFLSNLKIYQVHSATFESNILTNIEVLERLAELKSKYNIDIGITTSGYNQVDILQKALQITVSGDPLFDTFQVTYNILDNSILQIANILNTHNKKVIVKEALANGRLLPNPRYKKYAPLYKLLQTIADKYNVGIDAVAIRFCIDSLKPYKVLSGASNENHIKDNLKALEFNLNPEEIHLLSLYKTEPKVYWNERKQLTWN
ncbi:aldo/keto reductase [Aquimarina pacifica]|uniref:aldo/keto reductase n=1 Tax=Aquimarina pacifica TaxID=1296415 RepID=UPI00047187C3|nr:aldo/keto reductase [Aquimarina pacifica]